MAKGIRRDCAADRRTMAASGQVDTEGLAQRRGPSEDHEPRAVRVHDAKFGRGLLGPSERKNAERIAQQARGAVPRRPGPSTQS